MFGPSRGFFARRMTRVSLAGAQFVSGIYSFNLSLDAHQGLLAGVCNVPFCLLALNILIYLPSLDFEIYHFNFIIHHLMPLN